MGMYTELALEFDLKETTPQSVMDVLFYLMNEQQEPNELPNHPLFQTDRWRSLFLGTSTYFEEQYASLKHDGVSYHLKTCANLKNYQGEIDLFLDFITPYIDGIPGEYLGHKRYEEDETKTHIFFLRNRKIEFEKEKTEPIWGEDDYWLS